MIKIETLHEFKSLLGSTVMEVQVLGNESGDEPYCSDEEIFLECNTEKNGILEVRIYVDSDGNLCVYTD